MKLGNLNLLSWTRDQYRLGKTKWKEVKHKKTMVVIITSFIAIVASAIVNYLVIPAITDFATTRLRQLRNDTAALRRWERQQVPFITNLYLWNLTNADQVVNGISNPKFQEVGPYAFEQTTVKTPIEFKEDSIVYTSKTTYHFRADLTAPRSLNDKVVTLQAALYGAAVLIQSMAPSMMFMIEDAVPSLFPGLDSIFVTVRVGDYLFDGLVMDCSGSGSSAAQIVCGALPSSAPPTIRQLPDSPNFAYSFLHHKNGTVQGPYVENRGMQDIRRVAQITRYKGEAELDIWQSGSECDRLRGTDTLHFAPFVSKDDKLEIFIPDVCQVFPLYYQNEDRLKGLGVYKFTLTNWLETKDKNPDNACYCLEGKEEYCSKNGVRDISECMKAPVIMSQPHFLGAEAEFRKYAQGSSPDPDRHLSELYIEPQTGQPIKANKRIQFNMPLRRIEGFSLVENVSEGLFPLVWLEETILLDEETLWPVRFPLLILWLANFICICILSLMVKVFVCAVLTYLYLSKVCCFRKPTSNRVVALFYHPSKTSETVETVQTST